MDERLWFSSEHNKIFLTISGIFDLKPMEFSWLLSKLNLNSHDVNINSTLNLKPTNFTPIILAKGSNESKEFNRQSLEYYKLL